MTTESVPIPSLNVPLDLEAYRRRCEALNELVGMQIFTFNKTKKRPMLKQEYRNTLMLFGLMFIQFGVITLNTLGIASHNYFLVFCTDIVLSLLGFTILKKCIEASTWLERVGYALGGACGAQVALFIR